MLKKKTIQYLGVQDPQTMAEIEVEMAGLDNVIKQAEEQITRLRQAIAVFKLESSQQTKENLGGLSQKSRTEKTNSET